MKKLLLILAIATTFLNSCTVEKPEGFEKCTVSKNDAKEEAYGIVWMELDPDFQNVDPVFRPVGGYSRPPHFTVQVFDDKGKNLLSDENAPGFCSESKFDGGDSIQYNLSNAQSDDCSLEFFAGKEKESSEITINWADGSSDTFRAEAILNKAMTKWGYRFYLNENRINSARGVSALDLHYGVGCEMQKLIKKPVIEQVIQYESQMD